MTTKGRTVFSKKTFQWLLGTLFVFSIPAIASEPLPVIPEAHGFGIETPAGSGRHLKQPNTRVIRVTNLNKEGPGSFREAIEAEGPRVVVFEVSGNIDYSPIGHLTIKHPYLTIAGQTAPSPGITLKACELSVRASDVLIQHLRIRVGDLTDPHLPAKFPNGWNQFSERDCLKIDGDRVVVDHCSFSWATDENVQTRGNDLTLRNNIISEGLNSTKHHKGSHSRGLLVMNQSRAKDQEEGQRIAITENLFVHNVGRNPTVNGGVTAVIANNLVYGANFGFKADCTARQDHYQWVSIQGNVIEQSRHAIIARATHADTRYFIGTDNLFNGNTIQKPEDAWKHVYMPFAPGVKKQHRASRPPIAIPGYTIRPVAEVKGWVMDHAGAHPNDRDPVDRRVVQDVRRQTGSVLASQETAGGWPSLAEKRRKLKVPKRPNNDDNRNGYTNLEEWLHQHARAVEDLK